MQNLIKNMRLSVKVSLLGVGSVLLTAIALVALAVWQSDQFNILAQKEVDELINSDLDHITQGIYNLVKTENEAVQDQVNENLNVAQYILSKSGEISLGGEVLSWNAINQFSNEKDQVDLPKFLVGNQWLGKNTNPGEETFIVDEISRLTGETATIFQRINERGDMLRVATTVMNSDNKRAIGTFIPAIKPDGSVNPVIATVLKDEIYNGRAFVVDEWYLTAYKPVKDKTGNVLGMLYVGVKQKSVASRIRQAVMQTKVGKTGYVYVLAGKGENRGHYIISQNGLRDGDDIWETKDSDGRFIAQSVIKKAITLKSGNLTTVRYRWQNPEDHSPRWKIARLAYYEPWDWVIGTCVDEDELRIYQDILRAGQARMANSMGLAGFVIIIFVGFLSVLIAWTISRPIREMTMTVETIMNGDLTQIMDINSHDEIGTLAQTFNGMTQKLKETLKGLRKSEEKYRRIFENAIEGLFQTSFDGVFVSINPAMVRILGYDSSDEVMQSVSDIRNQLYVHPEDRDEILSQIAEKGIVIDKEIQIYHKDKSVILLSLSLRLARDNAGNPLNIQGFATDITQHKNLEEQLLQSQKLEAVGKLTGGIAHDFNNLLTVMTGHCDLVLKRFSLVDTSYQNLCEIRKAGDRAISLTRQLLAFSRKQVMQPVVINLNELIITSDKMLCRLIGEDVEYVTLPANDLWSTKADPGQIEQVITNLVVNARDAMKDGGRITVETANVTLDEDYCNMHIDAVPGEYVMISVSDTGCGIPKQSLDKIFDPFFTTKEKENGTGLGLSTVYGIVKQSGGSVYVYSEVGLGSVFKIYLPRVVQAGETVVSPPEVKLASFQGTETILVVEDEDMLRDLVKELAEEEGYKILIANDGEDALAVVNSYTEPIHLLLTDVVMPKMSGKELADLLSVQRPTTKILFMSGYTDETIGHHGILDEGINYINKPFSSESLLMKIREVLDTR